MDMFERIRANRIAALALAKQRRQTEFSPFRCSGISAVSYDPGASDRGDLKLTLVDGREVTLPHFYVNHALRLQRLAGQEQLDYLKEIWLNYNAWRMREG